MAKQNLTERVIRGSTTVIFFAVITSIFSYGLRMLYSRVLTIEEYGLYFAFISLFTALSLYTDLGFGYSITYLVPKFVKKGDYQSSWSIYKYAQVFGVGAAVIVSIILIAFAPWIAQNYFKVEEAKYLLYIFCVFLIVSNFVSNLHALFIGLQQEKYYSAIQAVRIFLTVSLSILIIFFTSPNVIDFALITAISYLICAVIFKYIFLKNNKTFSTFTFNWDQNLFKKMYTYALPTLLASSVYTLIIASDVFFLTWFRGLWDVGLYNVILPLAAIPLIILSPISNFVLPLVSHLMEKERKKVSILIKQILVLVPFTALYFSLFTAVFASSAITLVFGQKWEGLADTQLSILAVGYVIASLSVFFTTIVMGIGKARERLSAIMIIAFISVLLNGFFVYYFGLTGAVIASAIIHLLSVILIGRIINSVIKFNYPYFFYLKITAFSIIFYLLIQTLNINPASWISFIFSGIVYSLIIFLLGLYLKVYDMKLVKIFTKNISKNLKRF